MSDEQVSNEDWLGQRLANARIHNSRLERRIAQLREGLRRIKTGKVTKAILRQMADETIRADDTEATASPAQSKEDRS